MFYSPEAHNSVLFTVIGSPWAVAAIYLLVINLVTFLVFGLDKWKAKRKEAKESVRRVPEKTLFLVTALFGGLGGTLGMYFFRHKTRHWYFVWGIPAILVIQIALAMWLMAQKCIRAICLAAP